MHQFTPERCSVNGKKLLLFRGPVAMQIPISVIVQPGLHVVALLGHRPAGYPARRQSRGRRPAAYHEQYPACDWLTGDCNGDGYVTFADIDPFVAVIGTTCP